VSIGALAAVSVNYELRPGDITSPAQWYAFETRAWHRAWRNGLSLRSMDPADAAAVRALANVLQPPIPNLDR
jgi:hypothetical protein